MRVLPLFLVACTSATLPPPSQPRQGGPRGLHADEHRELARDHDERARQQHAFPITTPMVPGDPSTGPQSLAWYRSWDASADHERLARVHRGEAAAIEAAFAEACGPRTLAQASVSPLAKHRIGGWNTSTGAVVYLSPQAGAAETLLADLRCHRAWMMLASTGAMEDCPLDLPGLKIDARGDSESITLVLSVEPKLVGELQRRIAKEAEQKSGN